MGGEKGKKKREFIVAAAINRVYGRTKEKSVCLDGGKKGERKEKEEKPAPEAGCLHRLPASRELVFKLSFRFINGRIHEIYRMADDG